ncbi:Hypothetical predicted protein [Olea europaea subsp. europaea]|uniref:Uncharacterized protein n=1 Tax=Olea europaea subsp. europaea TaxID=158383 RepID=A0A8S0RS81_OLEEU|nr:Hypothetical predicted protein [Olea europaea subsp. europaea]
MAVNRIALLAMVWLAFAALAVSAQTSARLQTIHVRMLHLPGWLHTTLMFGFVVAVVSFFAMKEMI